MPASPSLASLASLASLFGCSVLALAACGGAVAPSGTGGSTDGSNGSSGAAGGSASATSGGASRSNPDQPSGGATSTGGTATCTVGSYVFCRCQDASEGTKECLPDRTFGACACDDAPPPPPLCSYPPPLNPPGCPATYSHAYQGQPCDTLNLACLYPGAGDGDANGCASTAGLQCRVSPGGATSWVATQ
jgi:hypothetical protein